MITPCAGGSVRQVSPLKFWKLWDTFMMMTMSQLQQGILLGVFQCKAPFAIKLSSQLFMIIDDYIDSCENTFRSFLRDAPRVLVLLRISLFARILYLSSIEGVFHTDIRQVLIHS